MKISKLFRAPLLRKPSTRWLFVFDVALLAALTAYSVLRIRPRDSAVAARYSTLQDVVQLGRWYWHYLPVLFLLIALIINVIIANLLLRAEDSVELSRFAIKILFFQLILSVLTFVVSFQLIEAL